ncbi:MAG: hypothetical protein NUV64_02265 [Parcubacteria group bacterium]|nr:hypothetical protein [Parcubacteria group bacterium]MCR4342857.1 hypothetical protein [Patescibacteria group bacterium]
MSEKNNARQLAISAVAYTSASIFGPLIIFGGIGFYLSKQLDRGKVYLFVGIGIAFIVTNILQFFKVKKLLKKMNEESRKEKGEVAENKEE